FNRYGRVSGVLDLKQRTIRKEESARGTIDESPILDGRTVSIQSPAAGEQSYLVKLGGSGAGTNYRIPSGRIPSCYTLLAGEKLGVRNPVLFSDNLGFLAMWDSSGDELRRVFGGHESMITSISPSSSGQIFVTGSTDRTIRIWSLLNHRKSGIFDFKYENSSVIRVIPGSSSEEAGVRVGDRIVSVDGHTLDEIYEMMLYGRYTYQPDQLVPVIMGRGEQTLSYQMKLVEGFDYIDPLLNVFVGDQGQWIIWTPRGYFDCSPGADQLIGWHVNRGPAKSAEFFRVQQFRKSLYRPDIIDRIIELGDVDAAEHQADSARKLGKVVNLPDQKEFQAHRPPVVRIESPAPDSSPKDARSTVVAKASSENELPISRVTLLHNGTPARVFRPANPAEGKSLNISHRLTLFPGKNEISLIAENSSATSSADDCRIVLQSQATAEKSRVFVLSIGISSYLQHGKGLENLRFAADDARAFAAAVEQQSHGRIYEAVQTKLLLDDAARRTDFLEGLQWLVDQVKPGDVVMLFFSGHGFLDDGSNFYFSTHEVEPEKLRSTGVSWRDVIGILHEELPACKRLVFLDACHADGIAVSGTQSPLHDMAAPEMGTIFYASCTLQQKSFEREEWRHGAFTKAILDVLGDTAADVFPRTGDGLISTTELSLGVTDRVSTMTGNQQNPVVYSPDRLKLLNILELKN
ncbi:MAG: caspase family protein, partial [Planctomyces sp.]